MLGGLLRGLPAAELAGYGWETEFSWGWGCEAFIGRGGTKFNATLFAPKTKRVRITIRWLKTRRRVELFVPKPTVLGTTWLRTPVRGAVFIPRGEDLGTPKTKRPRLMKLRSRHVAANYSTTSEPLL